MVQLIIQPLHEIVALWPLTALSLSYSLCRELSEHGKEDGFPEAWEWWNTGTAWRNKHEWGWLFEDVLVFVTDAEHFFQWLGTMSLLALLAVMVTVESYWAIPAFMLGLFLTGIIKKFTALK